MELRDETSLDIVPYINKKKVEIILVPLNNKLTEYKEKYIFIMDRHVKILLQYNILCGQTANISKGRVSFIKYFSKIFNILIDFNIKFKFNTLVLNFIYNKKMKQKII